MRTFKELQVGQFFEKDRPKSISDKYFLKVSPSFALRVRLYTHQGQFNIGDEKVKFDSDTETHPLIMLRGRAHRFDNGGRINTVAQGYD